LPKEPRFSSSLRFGLRFATIEVVTMNYNNRKMTASAGRKRSFHNGLGAKCGTALL
jgi:hypothetical protein